MVLKTRNKSISMGNSIKDQILVVDDAVNTLEVLQRNLTSQGYKVFIAQSVAEAVRILESTTIDLVITDYKMPKVSGLDLIKHVRENFKSTEIIMITGYASIEGAVHAVKNSFLLLDVQSTNLIYAGIMKNLANLPKRMVL